MLYLIFYLPRVLFPPLVTFFSSDSCSRYSAKSSSLDCKCLFISITCFVILVAHMRFSMLLSTFISIASCVFSPCRCMFINRHKCINDLIDNLQCTCGYEHAHLNTKLMRKRKNLTSKSIICWLSKLVLRCSSTISFSCEAAIVTIPLRELGV